MPTETFYTNRQINNPQQEDDMIKVKTFGEPLEPFRARMELDTRVN